MEALEHGHQVPLETVGIWWSGAKGFSVEIPGELFGGFRPSRDLPRELRALAIDLLGGLDTADLSIYEKLRLWRVPNTRNGKTGLFKVPLTLAELNSLDIADIRQLAIRPRNPSQGTAVPLEAVPGLVELYRPEEPNAALPPSERPQRGRGWVAGAPADLAPGRRNTHLFSIAGRARQAGFSGGDR